MCALDAARAIIQLTFSRPLRKTCADGGKQAARWLCLSMPGLDSAIVVPMQIMVAENATTLVAESETIK